MSQVNFNDKQSGDQLTANDVNSLKSAINDNESLISNGTVSGYYDSNNQFRYNHHIIPASNANFDLGSAENKVRHLYLSPDSLWIGDEAKISSSEGKLSVLQRDKDKLPSYITDLGGSLEDAYMFLNVNYANEITLAGLEEYAKSLDPTADLSKIFPAPSDPGFNENDYSDTVKVNKNQNQRKKIYINFDMEPSIPTLDLREHTDFEFYIDEESANYFLNTNFGEMPVKLIPTEYSASKFNIFITRPSNIQDDNEAIFNGTTSLYCALSNNAGNMNFKNLDQSYLARPATSQDRTIHLECMFVKSTNDVAPEQIVSLVGTNPNDSSYTYKMTVDGVDYYWLSNNQALEGITIYDQQSTKPDASPGDYKLYIVIESGNPVFFLGAQNNPSSRPTSSQYQFISVQGDLTWNGSTVLNANIVQYIYFGETNLLDGTLYTKYNYYGDTTQYSDDGRGAA